MRGERSGPRLITFSMYGSSPHARGTRQTLAVGYARERFIPACAGNAQCSRRRHQLATVHPRMRGERRRGTECSSPTTGSSPHARGTRQAPGRVYGQVRFIPACAGNAVFCTPGYRDAAVHPRMRGERVVGDHTCYHRNGSSPHARGTPAHGWPRQPRSRFIPACAGNACPHPCPPTTSPVHPRMRGERLPVAFEAGRLSGSSPHARGTLGNGNSAIGQHRFIPACAGNAAAGKVQSAQETVHPRMRGERRPSRAPSGIGHGSSPHARGTRSRRAAPLWRNRFIPACARNATAP